jgi:hypothetical protein
VFGPKPGSWWCSSEKDPRWNASGDTQSLLFSAGPPPEMLAHLKRLKKTLGPEPDDLQWGGMKD